MVIVTQQCKMYLITQGWTLLNGSNDIEFTTVKNITYDTTAQR